MHFLSLYLQLFALLIFPTALGVFLAHKGAGPRLSGLLFNVAYFFFNTGITVLAVWKADLANDSWTLPFLVLSGWILSVFVARSAGRFFNHSRKQQGSFLFTVCLSNHGFTLLGIVALVLFGEQGLAQATYAQFFIIPFLVFFCFPAARRFGRNEAPVSFWVTARASLFDSRNLVLVAMLVGLALNLAEIPQPDWAKLTLRPLVYGGCLSSCVAIGIGMKASEIGRFFKENLFSFAYRSTLYPLWFVLMATLAGLSELDRNVLILFGVVPSAVFANMIAEFYDLDKDMTNSVFLVSTVLFLVITLPVFIYFIGV
ncbi:MAG: AEC family transporter [Opitutales bacterium]|nr:AEC family transporter [Opitutales bacterium]NRA26068.1 AEC family transporter [Opitutales bacterium]